MSLPSQRKKARSLLVQALYQWQISKTEVNKLEAQFVADNDFSKIDRAFFHEFIHGIPGNLDEVDGLYEPHLDRSINSLDPISIAVLRLGCYELEHRIDVPYRVVINEAVNLAKKFGPTDSFKYINGIMDKVALDTRKVEIQASRQKP